MSNVSKIKLGENVYDVKDASAARKNVYYGTCTTAANTYKKVATVETFPLDGNGKPLVGTVVAIKYSNSNSYKTEGYTYQLNVNSTGDYPMYYNTAELATSTSANTLVAGYKNRHIFYMFNGTQWVWLTASYDTNTTYSGMTQAEIDAGTGTTARLITPQRLRDNFYTETEVNNLLAAKANTADLATVATSGSYNDLTDKPTIPAAITVDSTITQNGTNPVQGGAIYTALEGKEDKQVETINLYYDGGELTWTNSSGDSMTIVQVNTLLRNSSKNVIIKATFDGIGDEDGTRLYYRTSSLDDAYIIFHALEFGIIYWLCFDADLSDYSYLSLDDSGATDVYSYVPTTRKINNKALSSDITLTASDVGALPSNTHIPNDIKVGSVAGKLYRNDVNGGGNFTVKGNSGCIPNIIAGTFLVSVYAKSDTQSYTFKFNFGSVSYNLSTTNGEINDVREITIPSDGTFSGSVLNGSVAPGTILYVVMYDYLTPVSTVGVAAVTNRYSDLDGTPTIPTVNNGTLTIQKNGVTISTFTANQSSSTTANITVPTTVSSFTNDAGYLTSHQDISGKADKSEMSVSTSSDTTTITLKSGTSATVINQHNVVIGKLLNGNFYSGVYASLLGDWHFSDTAETGNSKKLYVDIVNKSLYKYEDSYVSITGDFVTTDLYNNDILDLWENKADVIQVVTVSTTGAVTQAMDANKFYDFTGSPTSLTLTLNSSSVGLSIYAGKFTSGTGFSNLSVPASVKLADNAPVVEAGGTYEFSIMDNLMLIVKEVAT